LCESENAILITAATTSEWENELNCFNIFLHAPWPSAESREDRVRPADGIIDRLMETLPAKSRRGGFDVVGTPFAELPGSTSYWQNVRCKNGKQS